MSISKEQLYELELEEGFLIFFLSNLTLVGSLGAGISLENDLQGMASLIEDLSPTRSDQEAFINVLSILKGKNRSTTLELLAAIATTEMTRQRNTQASYSSEAIIKMLVDPSYPKIRTFAQVLPSVNLKTLATVLKALNSLQQSSPSTFLSSVIVLTTATRYCQQTSLFPDGTRVETPHLLNIFFNPETPFNSELGRLEPKTCREFVGNFSIPEIQQKFLSRVVAEQERQAVPFFRLEQPIETFDDLVQIQSLAVLQYSKRR